MIFSFPQKPDVKGKSANLKVVTLTPESLIS